MYKIGEFSKLSGLSVHTLYHYENIGILRPVRKDDWTNYRYYSADQLIELNKVLALKDAGFSLEEIASFLIGAPVNNKLIRMLEEKAQALEAYIVEETSRLNRLRTNLFLIKNGGIPLMNEITLKQVEPMLVASIRKTQNPVEQTFDQFCEELWMKMHAHLDVVCAKCSIPCMSIYHSGLYVNMAESIDMEVVEPLYREVPASTEVAIHELPRVEKMASIVHKGPFSRIGETFASLEKWITENRYTISGPVREIYHKGEWITKDANEWVTEIQVPVE
ncbi:MerR family transcriptional regulator [Sutcliffiella rhizosphaerae]|uniref:HTH merR-type domain-containing protein n=1 Tax=Sutcliffiella rhizosphaerae TaxID=2880967 RepID=A0ABM8YMV7_9BACI|nr:GyrI-like domain-containing protein [Sutcliffiella rhizosphaerae]CAG9621251.1 hypothetical protein BACCIP111883_02023 [Sutcliffiella rhizosphaerae]